jgi:hypothetical protein
VKRRCAATTPRRWNRNTPRIGLVQTASTNSTNLTHQIVGAALRSDGQKSEHYHPAINITEFARMYDFVSGRHSILHSQSLKVAVRAT